MSKPSEILTAEFTGKLENKKRIIFYSSLLLLTVGCGGYVLTAGVTMPIEDERMIATAVCVGALPSVLFGVLSVYLLRGYRTTVRAIVPTLLVSSAGFLICSWVALRYFNFKLDRSVLSVHEVRFVLKHAVKETRTHFLAVVPSWKDKKKVIMFPVTREDYDRLEGGSCRVMTKAGYFGFEWIVASECN